MSARTTENNPLSQNQGLSTPTAVSPLLRELTRVTRSLTVATNSFESHIGKFSAEMSENLGPSANLLLSSMRHTLREIGGAMRKFDSSDPQSMTVAKKLLEKSQEQSNALASFKEREQEFA